MDAVGGFLAAGSACIVPRAFRQLRPGRIFAKQGGNAPLRHRWRDASSPYRGAFGGLPLAKPPLQGEVPPQAAEGCGTLPRLYLHGAAVPASSRKPFGRRYAARRAKSPALQSKANGRRNRELCLCGRRFFSRHPFAGNCRAGVHARRETFRLLRRFRADAWHRPAKLPVTAMFGGTFLFSAAFRLSPDCPAGEIARPTMQGNRRSGRKHRMPNFSF